LLVGSGECAARRGVGGFRGGNVVDSTRRAMSVAVA
jgi:hypothetical protein